MVSRTRRRLLATAGLAAFAGCASSGGEEPARSPPSNAGGTDDEASTRQSAEAASAGESVDGESTARSSNETSTGMPTTPPIPTAEDRLVLPQAPAALRDEVLHGGVPRDGIPAIEEGSIVSADDDGFLAPEDVVFGVVRDGEAHAYPQKILVHHEIVNDTLAGTPIAVTYCPLTGTAQGFERGRTTFGVSGKLLNSNLVMYDRATETWWPQMLATAIPGRWNERPTIATLREFRVVWTTWERWRSREPDTSLLSTENEHVQNYGIDPYGSYTPRSGYYADDETIFPALTRDDRLPPKRVVIGARSLDGAVAFRKESLRSTELLSGRLAETPVLAVYDSGLDTTFVYRNPRGLEFSDDAAADGGAVVGPGGNGYAPDALPLDRLVAYDAMWFAWAGYYPGTTLHG